MNDETKRQRKRGIMERRLDGVQQRHNLPILARPQMLLLIEGIMRCSGEGINEFDLRTLHKLTSRGLFG